MALDGEQYRIIVESAPNMIWRAGTDGLCNYFNVTWLRFTGRTMAQELGNGWALGVHPDDYERCVKTYMDAFERRESFEMVYRLRRYDGAWRWIHDTGTPYFDEKKSFAGYIGSCIDVHEQITGETWKSMAQTDGLTGLYNRRYFEQEAGALIESVQASGKHMTIVMFDIDQFKYFNDHYGHPFGDRILMRFAGILKDSIRDSDLLGRYGGDEFVLLLPHTSSDETDNIVKRIQAKCTQSIDAPENHSVVLSFSHGMAELEKQDTYEAFVERADKNMYAEKRRKQRLNINSI